MRTFFHFPHTPRVSGEVFEQEACPGPVTARELQRSPRPAGAPAPAPGPLGPADFAARADALGPFEPTAHIALAVSGGPDSMALALLAVGALLGDLWARLRTPTPRRGPSGGRPHYLLGLNYLVSHEPDQAIRELSQAVRQEGYTFALFYRSTSVTPNLFVVFVTRCRSRSLTLPRWSRPRSRTRREFPPTNSA